MVAASLLDRFRKYHRDNPRVYELFKRYAREARDAGHARYSARDILARIRWEVSVVTRGEFKCNNIASPFYARMLVEEDPTFAGFFEMRRAVADERPE
jgi:hypothetical protein